MKQKTLRIGKQFIEASTLDEWITVWLQVQYDGRESEFLEKGTKTALKEAFEDSLSNFKDLAEFYRRFE
jgi:hypothetical protein